MTDEPSEIPALRAALAAAEARAAAEAAEAARERAVRANAEALIAAQKLEIEKLRRALYGARSERQARLLDQLELQLEELEAAATEDELAAERERLSRHAPVVKAMNYMLARWPSFTRFLEDGRICLTNNAAERALRGAALGRKAWLFAGSERGGDRTAFMYTLIATAKLSGVDPQAWLTDVLARIADMPLSRLPELLPWNWAPVAIASKAA